MTFRRVVSEHTHGESILFYYKLFVFYLEFILQLGHYIKFEISICGLFCLWIVIEDIEGTIM